MAFIYAFKPTHNPDSVKDKACICDNCGRDVHAADIRVTSSIEDFWFCNPHCRAWFVETFHRPLEGRAK